MHILSGSLSSFRYRNPIITVQRRDDVNHPEVEPALTLLSDARHLRSVALLKWHPGYEDDSGITQ